MNFVALARFLVFAKSSKGGVLAFFSRDFQIFETGIFTFSGTEERTDYESGSFFTIAFHHSTLHSISYLLCEFRCTSAIFSFREIF